MEQRIEICDIFLDLKELEVLARHSAFNFVSALSRKPRKIAHEAAMLEKRLVDSYKQLTYYTDSLKGMQAICMSLSENFYVLEKAVLSVKSEFDGIDGAKLPLINEGRNTNAFRIEAIAGEIVNHRNGKLDESTIVCYLNAFQDIAPLTIAELNVLPLFLKLELLKMAARIIKNGLVVSARYAEADKAAEAFFETPASSAKQAVSAIEKLNICQNTSVAERLIAVSSERESEVLRDIIEEQLRLHDTNSEELLNKERKRHTSENMLAMNVIMSIKFLEHLPWERIFSEVCVVDKVLLSDDVYAAMDTASKRYYLMSVERIAARLKVSEAAVAKTSVALCEKGMGKAAHCGYYLIDRGIDRLYKAMRPDKKYIRLSNDTRLWLFVVVQALIGMTVFLAAFTGGWIGAVISIPVCAYLGFSIAVRVFTGITRPRQIPRLEVFDCIGEDKRTIVTVPTLITSEESLRDVISRLECHYLANRLYGSMFAVIGDFPDAETGETEKDAPVLELAKALVDDLNAKYSPDAPIFFYIHRRRSFDENSGRWMGYERKRGAVMAFIRLNRSQTADEEFIAIYPEIPPRAKFCVTLDSDTVLPQGTLSELIGSVLHPLNEPVIGKNGVVTEGYGLIAPRMEVRAKGSTKTRFSRIFSGNCGMSRYDTPVSDFYQDFFGEGIFGGKGIFNIDVFDSAVGGKICDNSVLSHDLLEGSLVGAGYAGDIVLYDSEPSSLFSWWKRQHRWIRGDFQLLAFLKRKIRLKNGETANQPLNDVSRYKIISNMKAALRYPVVLRTIIIGAAFGSAWPIALGLLLLLFDIAADAVGLFKLLLKKKNITHGIIADKCRTALRALYSVLYLPYYAWVSLDAVIRAVWRTWVSHKKMLEWQTASQAERIKTEGVIKYYKKAAMCVAFGALMLLACFLLNAPFICAILGIFWCFAPLFMYYGDMRTEEEKPDESEKEELKKIAAATWRFYEKFCTKENNFLPPDNFQEEPKKPPVANTSPTNIAMYVVSAVCAETLGFISHDDAAERMENLLSTLGKLEKWKGQLFNWYNIKSLRPLRPQYISTVDSGNLLASLWLAKKHFADRDDIVYMLDHLIENMDFGFLYDADRGLFHIGYSTENGELSGSWYDLLASESRLTSYIAVASGLVPKKHWFRLGREIVKADGGDALVSWSGTMFEYLMPELFLTTHENTLVGESCMSAVKSQIAHRRGSDKLWGVSESGYYAFDKAMYYQYRAFGIPRLALSLAKSREDVAAPYASLLALMQSPHEAYKNVCKMVKMGLLGEYGLYEAADYTSRSDGSPPRIVKSYMAHHQGMGLCAITNAVTDNSIKREFMEIPEMKAAEILLEEKIPVETVSLSSIRKPAERRQRGSRRKKLPEAIVFRPTVQIPHVKLLSNGSYTVLLTDGGMGYSKCGDVLINEFDGDVLTSSSGIFMFISTEGVNSRCATLYPGHDADAEYRAEFQSNMAVFSMTDDNFSVKTEVFVSAERNGEIRRLKLVNRSRQTKNITIGASFSVCLFSEGEANAHPAFTRLKVDASVEEGVLLFNRRTQPDAEGEWLYFALSDRTAAYSSDKLSFPGRLNDFDTSHRRTVSASKPIEAPIEPQAYGEVQAVVRPGESFEVALAVGIAQSKAAAICDAKELLKDIRREQEMSKVHAESIYALNGIRRENLRLYEAVAARLLLRLPESNTAALPTTAGMEALWRYGISGDLPLVAVKMSRASQMGTVRLIIDAVKYIRFKGFKADIAVIGAFGGDYRDELLDKMAAEVNVTESNIHIIPLRTISDEELNQYRNAASLFIDMDKGIRWLFGRKAQDGERKRPSASGKKYSDISIPKPVLKLFNGIGGFDTERAEYVILLSKGQHTPLPWSNIIANDSFGTLVTETGGGYTWCGNCRENKLTPWYNEPVSDRRGEFVFITDVESGNKWTLMPGKYQGEGDVTVRHGYGYTSFESGNNGLVQSVCIFTDLEKPVKYSLIRIYNPLRCRRRLSVSYFADIVLGQNKGRSSVCSYIKDGIPFSYSLRRNDDGKRAYIAVSGAEFRASVDREAVMLLDSFEAGEAKMSGFAAAECELELSAGETKCIVLLMGCETEENAKRTLSCTTPESAADELEAVKRGWGQRLDRIKVRTVDAAFDTVMNGRLLYQTIASRLTARTGYYQCGGAIGFRDQLQDVMALIQTEPETAREYIISAAEHQYSEGDVMHWWHNGIGGVRTRFSDDRLFLPLAVAKYIEITGDEGILDIEASFLDGKALAHGEDSSYMPIVPSHEKGSIFEHCMRAIKVSMKTGRHGIPLIGGGDWNDGMDKLGRLNGESIWLGWLMMIVIKLMLPYTSVRDEKAAGELEGFAVNLKISLEEHGWDKNWYKRVIFDGGALGSSGQAECTIDAISQIFAVFAGAKRGDEAMRRAMEMLCDEENGLMKLLSPPFDKMTTKVGYIQEYLPGVRENGGQYSHATAWAVIAEALLKNPVEARRLFACVNPIEHTLTEFDAARYKAEPYAVAGDIYSVGHNASRAGWSWYTGAAGWLYTAGLEYILGVRKKGNVLSITPCAVWDRFELEYRYQSSLYKITVVNGKKDRITVDGKNVDRLILKDDGKTHNVMYHTVW